MIKNALIDYHIHSDISGDCSVDMQRMVSAAFKKGLKEICFTEHIDFDFPGGTGFAVDLEKYDKKFGEVKDAYPGISIHKGVEAGLDMRTKDAMAKIISESNVDFVIGSQHLVFGLDPFDGEVWRRYTQRQVYDEYLRESIENASACDFFDVIGHIGYLSKACPYSGKILRYSDHRDAIEQLLKIIVDKGKGIEVNTSTLAATGSVMPEPPIVKRFFELGGEIITVGSDAHVESSVGRAVLEALQMIKSIGFRYICAFDKRKPRFLPLE